MKLSDTARSIPCLERGKRNTGRTGIAESTDLASDGGKYGKAKGEEDVNGQEWKAQGVARGCSRTKSISDPRCY
jgi:hypothetical protein